MSSPRHVNPVSGVAPGPDVLSEATDLDTLFQAIVGKGSLGTPATEERDHPDEPPGYDDEIGWARAAPTLPPRTLDRRASSFAAPVPDIQTVSEAPRAEIAREPVATRAAIGPIEIGTHPLAEPEIAERDSTTNITTVRRLRLIRTSPWPVMVIVGATALGTVSAIGLRSGSSSANLEPPSVASPQAVLPSGYSPQLPAAPLTLVDRQLAPPSTAFGDSLWRPATSTRSTDAATPESATVAANPARLARPSTASMSPAVPADMTMTTPETSAAATPALPTESLGETVRVVDPPSAAVQRAETSAPTTGPPAVSSARLSAGGVAANEMVPELPKPAGARTIVPIVAARRLTGGLPEYSSALRRQKISGVVDVQLKIDLNGRVISASAVSGPPPLRQAAEAAVLTWRYAPATRNGNPIASDSIVSFLFDPSQSRRP